jgi:hypothetical protein
MKGYAILRIAKYQNAGAAGGLEAHHERKKEEYQSNPDIRTQDSHKNVHIIQPQQSYKKVIEKRIAESGCRTRSNSVRFIDTILTASPFFFDYGTPEETRTFFNTAMKFMENKVGKENIVSAVVHLDEATPHMHLLWVPLTKDNRLCAKEIIGGPKGLTAWQDEFHAEMAKTIPGLERGKSKRLTGREHLPVKAFKAAAQMDRIDQKLNTLTELNTLRRYVANISPHMKEMIEEDRKSRRKQHQKQERSR